MAARFTWNQDAFSSIPKLQAKIKAEQAAVRQTIEQQYRNRPGEYGGRNRQIEREQAGPGYDKLSEAGSF